MNNEAKLLLSVKEASELLGVGTGLVYEMVRKHEIPHIRLGRLVKIPLQGLETWIAQQSGLATSASEHSSPRPIAGSDT